jgi:hypothetical protein
MRSSCRVVLACLLGLMLSRGAARAQPAAVDDRDVRQRLQAAIRADADLHGSWISVRRLPDQEKLAVSFIVDSARAAQQTAVLKDLVRRLVPQGKIEIDPVVQRFPVSDLVSSLQARLDEQLFFAGCLIDGASFEPSPAAPERLRLVLLGRIPSGSPATLVAQIKGKIIDACIATMKADSRWPDPENANAAILPTNEGIVEVRPSAEASALLFNEGLRSYHECLFSKAEDAFARAFVEAPERTEYRYWRIAAAIGTGDEERAYRLLRPLVHQRRDQSEYRFGRVLDSLERVQGPVRYSMDRLEARAWTELGKPAPERQR